MLVLTDSTVKWTEDLLLYNTSVIVH